MTPFRETEMLQAKRVGLQGLLAETTDDPLEKPALEHAIRKIDARLKELADKPKINPEAEMFFVDGQVTNHHGLEITFASDMLKSYQNMVTNHYAAKNYGLLRKTGRRHGEAEAHLFLTALPRGSFGMQLSQPQISDWVAAGSVSKTMEELSGLVDASAESDAAFEGSLVSFNPRVLKPLTEFMKTLNAGGGSFRLVTGMKQVKLNHEKIQEAYMRVSSASSAEREITIPGEFGGIIGFSCEFDFRPHAGEVIKGPLAEEITDEEIERMNHDFTFKACFATLKETTVTTRSGKKKPTFELIRLTLIKEEPPVKAITPAPAATPPKELPPTPAGPATKAVRPKIPQKVPPAIETPPAKAQAPTPAEPTTPVTPPPPPVQKKTPPKTEPPPSEPDKK